MLRLFTRPLAVLAALGLILFLAPSCSRGPGGGGGAPALPSFLLPQGAARPVEVVFASPKGALKDLPAGAAVTVVFNQPMVPLQGLGDPGDLPPVSLEPAVPGHWEWRGTATLVFLPDKSLPYATSYTVKVPSGVKSFSGQALAQDFVFGFTTPRPDLEASVPVTGAEFVRLDASLLLVFNQPMAAEAAAPALALAAGKASVPVQVRPLTDEEWKSMQDKTREDEEESSGLSRDHVLAVDPTGNLELGTEYRLEIREGLKGASGAPLGLEKTRVVTFQTVNRFALKEVRSEDEWRPDGALEFEFTNPVSPKELVAHLKLTPEVKIPEWYSEDDYATTRLDLYLPLEARTRYRVAVDAELKDDFGNQLGAARTKDFTTGDFAPALAMSGGQGILEARGDLRFPVGLLNLDRLRVRMAGLETSEVVPLLETEGAFWSDKDFRPPGGFEVDEEWTPEVPLNEQVDRAIDLRRVLGSRRNGFVFLQVTARAGKSTWDERVLLQVTDLGVSAKFSPENTLVWTTTLSGGEPLGGVQVEVRGQDNAVLWTGRTDSQGLAKAPGWAELGLRKKESWQTPVQYVVVRQGQDASYVSSDGSTGISPWDFDLDYDWSPRARTFAAHAFTERGLYRAGEQVHFKGTLRQSRSGRWVVPDDVDSLEYTIYDSRDEKLKSGTAKVSPFGSFDHTLDLDATAPSGFYRIAWRLPEPLRKRADQEGDLVGVSFRVEAYRPAQFEVKVEAGAPAYVLGETAEATLRGRYLFGAAMGGDDVRWSARLQPTTFQPADWPGFDFGPTRFGDEDQPDQERILVRDEGQLDAEGQRKVQVALQGVTFEGPAELVVEGTVTSASRQQISGRAAVPVHPASFSLGLKAAGSLQKAGAPVPVQLVAVDPAGKAVSGRKVQVQLIRREWNSVRKAGAGGRYEWVSEVHDSPLATQAATSGSAAVEVPVTPPKAGLYVVRATATDEKGRKALSETWFYTWGGDYVAWAREDEDRIELVPDRKNYAPGDTARILVKSPYERAQALVTVERELVLDRYVVDVEGTADTVEVPIRSAHLPNVFVSVLLVQGRVKDAGFGPDGMDLGKPSFKIGYVNLPVEATERRLKVEVTTGQPVYEPRQEARVQVQVTDAQGRPAKGEVCLAVVDEGVLSLIGYQTPGYFDAFYGQRPLSVRTSEARLDVIGQRSYGAKGANQGGGGGLVGDYREDFVTTAFWSPRLVTDDQGRAEVSFRLPDSLTRFRVMAVVQTMDARFGSGEVGLTVQKPLLLQPSLPRFARKGDRFQAGVLVFNHTQEAGEVLVEVDAASLQVGERKQIRVRIDAGQEKEVLFDFQAPQAAEAEVGFRASMGAHTDSLKMPIPVHQPVASETVATSGTVEGARTEEGLKVPGGVLPGTATLEASASSSAISGVDGAVRELLGYPYGCLEQRLSRLVPMLIAGDLVEAFDTQDVDARELRSRVQAGLDELTKFQLEKGGFAMWPGGAKVHDYLTAYAVTTLLDAKERGYRVDPSLLKKARGYMKSALHKSTFDYPYSEAEQRTVRAALLEALTRMGYQDASALSNLFRDRGELTLDAQVFLLRAAHRTGNDSVVKTLRDQLANLAKVEARIAWFEEGGSQPWLFGSSVRTTGMVLEALLEQGDFPLAPRVVRWLMEARKEGHWGSTQEDVSALRALLAYRKRYEAKAADLEARIQVAGKEVLSAALSRKEPVAAGRVALDEFPAGDTVPVTVERSGKGSLHYDLRLRYAPAQDPPARDQGFTVFKTVRPLEGKEVHSGPFTAGQTYRVTLTVLTPSERRYVVVDDPIPAGFEVVQTTFETESDDMRQVLRNAGVERPWMGTFGHFEIEDSRVLLFADGLQAGEHTFEYLVRAMMPGTWSLPATRAEEMYHPEIFGTTASQTVEVRPTR